MSARAKDLVIGFGLKRSRPPARAARPAATLYRDRAKRALDVALVLLSAPVTLPLIAVMALLVSLDGGAPFYRQRRIGRAGRVFGLWKIRTMVRDADAQLEAHLAASPSAAREWHATQKLRDDPRITRVGRFLRKTSLDELPQFWNVLTGDMSLIGPRPMMVEQAELYPGRAYYALRPGITGPWQVSDRNDTTFAARAEYDQAYYDGLSLGVDAAIFLRTFAVILLCTGR
jgi:lipopolysaccharide/colanic/teichoic acid biosynthesis glycosyltransferase